MEDNNIEQAYKEFLKNEVEKYCNKDGYYEVYWDSNDIDVLKENLPGMLENYDSGDFIDYISQQVFESYMNSGWYPEDTFLEQIELDINSFGNTDMINYYDERVDNNLLVDDLTSVGYNGLSMGIEDVLSSIDIDVNVMVAPYNEQNFDMGSIISAFGSDYQMPDLDWLEQNYLDNGITYLIHQQGYKLMNLYDELYGNSSNSKLIKSIAKEISNNSAESMSGLTLCSTISALDYSNIIQAMKSGTGYLEFPTNTVVGLYNAWTGSGSVFEIELEKPFIVSVKDVKSIQPDSVSSNSEYSVSEVYGNSISNGSEIIITQSAPNLVQENLDDVLAEVKQKYGKVKGGNYYGR